MCLSAGVACFYLFKVINSLIQDACVSSYKQILSDPLFLEPQDCNIATTHSGTLYVFVQLQSWLCVGRFCKWTMFCELYGDTLSDVSDHGDNESLHSDSDVPTTSSHKRLRSSTGPLTSQFPHTFFLTSIKTIFIML